MYIQDILSDIRLALAVGVFCAGGAAATLWWMLLYLIGEHNKKKRRKIDKKERSLGK